MLEQVLKKEIPSQLCIFDKLTEDHDPYYFAAWDTDENSAILRYWFWNRTKTKKNRKRVFIDEIESLLEHALKLRHISRQDFVQYCPRTSRNGPCGFAVIISVLKHIQVLDVADGEYRVKSVERLQQLLNNQ